MYRVFIRNWWKLADGANAVHWPGGLEPDPRARRTTIAKGVATEAEARTIAREYNRTHPPGRLSRKAEIEDI